MGKISNKKPLKRNSKAFRKHAALVKSLFAKMSRLERKGLIHSEEFQDAFGELVSLMFDLTDFSVSTPGFDGLLHVSGQTSSITMLRSALAEVYGAGAAFLGTAGTSNSNVALMLALQCIRPERRLFIVDSAMHASIRGGLLASGAKAVILQRKACPRTGIPLSNIYEGLVELLDEHSKDCNSVVLTMPGYEGGMVDLEAIYDLCRSFDVELLLDGAWGALYGMHPSFPEALIKNADYVNLSLHKASIGPQQVSLTLVRDRARARDIEDILRQGFVTTSPNPAMLVATEHRLRKMLENSNHYNWDRAIAAASQIRESASYIHPNLRSLTAEDIGSVHLNPVQVIFDTSDIDVSAICWQQILSRTYKRDVEHAEQRHILISMAPGNIDDVDAFIYDLKAALSLAIAERSSINKEAPDVSFPRGDAAECLDIRRAVYSPSEWVPALEAVGRTLAGFLMTYPTGRGLSPSAIFSDSDCAAVLGAISAGYDVHGLRGESTPKVRVTQLANRGEVPEYFDIQTFRTPGLPAALANEASDFYACGWVGDSFNQFVFHESAPLTALSPTQYIERSGASWPESVRKQDWYTLAQLDEIAASLQPGYHRIVSPQECRKVHAERFSDAGYLTIVRDLRDGELVGMLSSRVATFKRLAETTEWFRPFLFCSDHGLDGIDRAFDTNSPLYKRALDKIAWHFDLSEKHTVCSIDAQLVRQDVRGSGVFLAMMKSMADAYEPEHAHLPLLSSISGEGTLARTLNESVASKVVYDILGNGECLAYSQRTFHAMAYALAHKWYWKHAIKEQFCKESMPFYRSFWDHPNVEVRLTEDGRGLGVFATGDGVKKGETVARFVGETYRAETATGLHEKMVDHAIQVGPKSYVYGQYGLAQLCNSSCNPNLTLHDGVELRAMENIRPEAELTWLYSSSEDSDWSAECVCGQSNCIRGSIRSSVYGFWPMRLKRVTC